uniref:Membrane protein m161 n=1 Tax=Mastomys natalensis cytomegalovirus 1 TaxID=2973541 RepID=A0A9Y1ILM2_9BETA|nr:membrane protein m161 [Mastomys natalensis cytomegalovirus 1]WEG71240.1 membrane protein m161 [Mastomys natalensis cytomegalovirus 1]
MFSPWIVVLSAAVVSSAAPTTSGTYTCERLLDMQLRCRRWDPMYYPAARNRVDIYILSIPGTTKEVAVSCDCALSHNKGYTISWYSGSEWIASVDGVAGAAVSNGSAIADDWANKAYVHGTLLFVTQLNDTSHRCMRCVCRSGTYRAGSHMKCLGSGARCCVNRAHARNWKVSAAVICAAIVFSLVISGLVLAYARRRSALSALGRERLIPADDINAQEPMQRGVENHGATIVVLERDSDRTEPVDD